MCQKHAHTSSDHTLTPTPTHTHALFKLLHSKYSTQVREADIGTRAGLFEVVKIADEFFTFIVDCKVRW